MLIFYSLSSVFYLILFTGVARKLVNPRKWKVSLEQVSVRASGTIEIRLYSDNSCQSLVDTITFDNDAKACQQVGAYPGNIFCKRGQIFANLFPESSPNCTGDSEQKTFPMVQGECGPDFFVKYSRSSYDCSYSGASGHQSVSVMALLALLYWTAVRNSRCFMSY